MNERVVRAAYILSQFPETHETFILREIREMERQGVRIEIFSLKKCRDKIVQTNALQLKNRTHYPNVRIRLAALMLTVFVFGIHPLKSWKLLKTLFRDNRKHPVYLLKVLSMFPMGVWIGWKSKRLNVRKIHAHWATVPAETARTASQFSGIPFSFTAHAWDIFLHPGNLERLIDDADKVITCTRFNKAFMNQKYNRNFGSKIRVLYHGLDSSERIPKRGPRTDGFHLLAVGRLVEQKGFSHLLRAISILEKDGREVSLWLVGEGPLRAALEKEARLLGIRDRVVFKGMLLQQEVFSLMRQADALVMPSVVAKNQDRDGIPNVVPEAMAHRLPVIGTSVSGLPEVIIDHVTGLLVLPCVPEKLAVAVRTLMENPELGESMAAKAGELVRESFDSPKNVLLMRKELGLI